jgi:hypothetical protein
LYMYSRPVQGQQPLWGSTARRPHNIMTGWLSRHPNNHFFVYSRKKI